MKRYALAALCAVLAALATSAAMGASATHRKVATNGSDSGDCTTAPCLTIGYAVARANAGDTIDVAAGTYAESVDVTKSLKLVGHNAVIDATGLLEAVKITGADAARSEIRGFTIEHALLEGIFVNRTGNVTIDHNTLVQNDQGFGITDGSGNPLYCTDQNDDCGEAIHLQTVTDSQVSHNLVQDNVGGILLTDEDGPTSGNEIDHNQVLDNSKDCGITLASHWFSFAHPAMTSEAGVFENTVEHNTSNGNGAAGIGVFAGPPGAAAWGNVIAHNTANDNGLPGVAIHSHFGIQNAEDNVVVDNFLSGNGADDDAETGAGAGIVVFADLVFHDPPSFPAASTIQQTTVAGNHIADEHFGIFLKGANDPEGLQGNHFAKSVDVSIEHA